MYPHLVNLLRCPECQTSIDLEALSISDSEIEYGVLLCENGHAYPIARGIPRFLPKALEEWWPEIVIKSDEAQIAAIKEKLKSVSGNEAFRSTDTRTKANFSHEWDNHDIGDKTWTMDLDDRVRWFFLDPLRFDKTELEGKRVLDAGCGNGSQSVVYAELGLEVIAVDLSTGLEKGHSFRKLRPDSKPDQVHFINADLQAPPLQEGSFDIIHSTGVLHHTPNTEFTFRKLRPLLKDDGTFYVWLYKYEPVVTPIVNAIRSVTTRIPTSAFAAIANAMSVPFIGFCWTVNKLGLRKYVTPTRKEATIAVHDIFGAPYAHYHSFDEVADWFRSVGLDDVWLCNDDRRGFGVCGRSSVRSRTLEGTE